MQVIINGATRTTQQTYLMQLLQELEIDPRRIAVELNMNILPKAEYETTPLNEGDAIEIVHFVGGG